MNIGDEDFGFRGEVVAGDDQVVAGESWSTRGTHQVDRDEGRRRRK